MKVLLIDDHPLILMALQSVIQGLDASIEVIAVDNAAAGRARLQADDDIDLLLLDLALGDDNGFDLLDEVRAAYPAIPVVVISATERSADVIRAIDAGAMAFVPKRSSHAALKEALSTVMSGGIYLPEPLMALLALPREPAPPETAAEGEAATDTQPGVMYVNELAQPAPSQQVGSIDKLGLTPRQKDVLALLLQGKPNKLIARELNLSVETVKDHVAAVLRVLNVSSRTQAVLAVGQMTQLRGGFPTWKPTPRS
jgi:DNA-binding NarL/FixJ family response regulator